MQVGLGGALARLYGHEVSTTGAGRTDAGVHARAQVVHLDVPGRIPPLGVRAALNTLLPPDVRVLSCLLYTSPSPRDRTRSRMPSSA